MNAKYLIWFCVGLALIQTAYATLDTANNVLYLTMDNADTWNISTLDKTSSHYNFSIGSCAVTGQSGVLGQAYYIPNNVDAAILGSYALTNGLTNFTVNMWIKITAGATRALVDFDQTNSASATFSMDTDNSWFLRYYDGSEQTHDPAGAQKVDGGWTMVTYVKNGTHLYGLLNGSIYQSATATGNGITQTRHGRIQIGKDAGVQSHNLDGYVDEVSIWNRTLTPTELAELFNSGAGWSPYGAVAPVITNQRNFTNDRLTYIMSAQSDQAGQCSLWGNWTGSWVMNESKTVLAATAFNFTAITFSGNKVYSWGINCTGTTTYTETWGSNISFSTVVPSVTLAYPATNNVSARDVNLTFTVSGAALDNCTSWDNRSGSWASSNFTTTGTVATHDFGKTGLSTQGVYLWGVRCVSGTTPYWSTTNNTLIIDTTYPTITIHPNNEWLATNYSKLNPYDDNFYINLTFTDERDLDEVQIYINKSGTLYFNYTNTTLSGLTHSFYNFTNITAWPTGEYSIFVQVSDSHTANVIDNYDIVETGSKLKFKTAEGNEIEVSSSDPSIASTTKSIDRYDFGFRFVDGKTLARTFVLKSKYPIKYKADSKYAGHFVVYSQPGKGNWIDFEGIGAKPTVTKVSDYQYNIVFASVADVVRFNSIGGLNVLTANYKWYRGNATTSSSGYQYNENGTFTAIVTKDSSISSISAELHYNSINYGSNTKTSTASADTFVDIAINSVIGAPIPYAWYVNITQADSTVFTQIINGSHSSVDWNLDNCTNGSFYKVLSFLIFDEENPSIRINPMELGEIYMSYWPISPLNAKNFTGKYPSSSNLSVCISNATSQLYANIYVKYKATNGFTHRYYLYNYSLTNTTTKEISIYNYNRTTGVSILNVYARDFASYNFYPNVVTTLQRYYPSEDLWRDVQMDLSGDFGLLTFNILERSTDYRLIFKDTSNHLLSTTTTLKFACTSSVCTQTKLLSPYDPTAPTTSLSIRATYSNVTGLITVIWTNPAGTGVDVSGIFTKETGKGKTVLCNNYTSGTSSGTFVCNVGSFDGTVMVQVNSTRSGVKYIDFGEYFSIATTRIGKFISEKEGAFWSFFLMLPIVSFCLYSPVAVLMAGVFSLIIISALGLMTAINISFVIVAIIVGIAIALKLET